MGGMRYWLCTLTLALIVTHTFATDLQMNQITSLIPAKEDIHCRVLQDKISLQVEREINKLTARVSFIYEYDFHFNPVEDGWLVIADVMGHESIEVDLLLSGTEHNSGADLVFRTNDPKVCQLTGRIKRQNDTDDYYYQRKAQVDLQVVYSQTDKDATVYLAIHWLEDIPGYGVFVSDRGSGITDKLQGKVSPTLFSIPSHLAKMKRSPRNKISFPSILKFSDDSLSPQISPVTE